jgi:hypothetical protein
MITSRYQPWIKQSAQNVGIVGTCAEVTEQMAEVFPELRRVRGHYHCPYWGKRAHWWMVTPDGSIVDPTAIQFPSAGSGQYVEWNEGDEEPIGKCANCGGHSYASKGGNDTVCGDACARSYLAYLG